MCGWRPVWEVNPDRLFHRVLDIARTQNPGSSITFINFVSQADFKAIMSQIGCVLVGTERVGDEEDDDDGNGNFKSVDVYEITDENALHVQVRHVYGDAASPETVEPLIMERDFETAIIFGTQANTRLAAHSMDTRVLSIMLLLRKISATKDFRRPTTMRHSIHVVGENQEDATSALALGPSQLAHGGQRNQDDEKHDPDFINTQAIYARALTQTMAYPVIRNAVNDLFNEDVLAPSIQVIPASAYVVLGVDIAFGVVRASCIQEVGHRTIAIGFVDGEKGNAVNMCPDHALSRTYTLKDKIVTLRRKI